MKTKEEIQEIIKFVDMVVCSANSVGEEANEAKSESQTVADWLRYIIDEEPKYGIHPEVFIEEIRDIAPLFEVLQTLKQNAPRT